MTPVKYVTLKKAIARGGEPYGQPPPHTSTYLPITSKQLILYKVSIQWRVDKVGKTAYYLTASI